MEQLRPLLAPMYHAGATAGSGSNQKLHLGLTWGARDPTLAEPCSSFPGALAEIAITTGVAGS